MAQIQAQIVNAIAGGAIAQWTLVKMGTGGKVVSCSAATDIPIGVATVPAAADGDAISLQSINESYQVKVKNGTAISQDGSAVGTNASATLVRKTSGFAIGFLKGTAKAGEVAEVIVMPHAVS